MECHENRVSNDGASWVHIPLEPGHLQEGSRHWTVSVIPREEGHLQICTTTDGSGVTSPRAHHTNLRGSTPTDRGTRPPAADHLHSTDMDLFGCVANKIMDRLHAVGADQQRCGGLAQPSQREDQGAILPEHVSAYRPS